MTTESDITAWLATQQDAMVALLREMVRRDREVFKGEPVTAARYPS